MDGSAPGISVHFGKGETPFSQAEKYAKAKHFKRF